MSFVCTVLDLYTLVIFGRILLSWIPVAHDSPVAVAGRVLIVITEPLMGPLRRALPMVRMGNIGLDLSPILLLMIIQVVLKGFILRCV